MAEEKNKDLTTEELLKKLMENFGEEAPKSGGEQLTIDDVTEKSTHKVYRCRNGKKEEAPGEAPEGMPDDEVSEMLLKSIPGCGKICKRYEGDRRRAGEAGGTGRPGEGYCGNRGRRTGRGTAGSGL